MMHVQPTSSIDLIQLSFQRPVILYDGVCNLCEAFVTFLKKRDKKGLLVFYPLQHDAAIKAVTQLELSKDLDTVVLLRQGVYYLHSDVLFQLIPFLNGPWKAVKLLSIFPRGFRDTVYRWIAARRHRLFGKKEYCETNPHHVDQLIG
ncbi:MAG: DCC1-like thiol-disulfide oxidoreductase family protein [Bacteroidota bacterium]